MDNELWSAHERRITRLEEGLSDMNDRMTRLQADVSQTAQLAKQIADDTRAIRDMTRGGKALGKFFAWMGGLLGVPVAVIVLVQFFKG